MKKSHKAEILTMLKTVEECTEEMERLFSEDSGEALEELCTQCQQCVIKAGELIEKEVIEKEAIEKEFTEQVSVAKRAVAYLEAACEAIYTIYTAYQSGEEERHDYAQLVHNLHMAAAEMKQVPVTRLALFLPYKADMWDCMESIWQAASEDERCESICLPIPYFELIGNEPQMCYDGPLFPPQVPIADYEEADIAGWEPDVIYIHNPFDDNNYVTSVHPDYYTAQLKKYTKLLVYVPYFIGGRDFPEEHMYFKSYENIDRIIVQDSRHLGQLKKYVPAGKLLNLGSPKLDKLVQFKRSSPRMPDEWAKAAGGRRLVFYNISLKGFLKYNEQFFMKMLHVFQIFSKRTDVALLYRPHPLLEATIKSMRPELLPVYEKLLQCFVDNNMGILDKSPDAARAAALCDAYIGEGNSSVAKYFGVLNKPVFVLDPELLEENGAESFRKVAMWDWKIEKEWVWFLNVLGNSELCRASLADGKAEVIARLPEKAKSGILYSGLSKAGDSFYFVPMLGDGLYEYDMQKDVCVKRLLETPFADKMNFSKGVYYDNSLYLIPCYYPAVVRVDLDTKRMVYYKECINDLIACCPDYRADLPICWWNGGAKDNLLYVKAAQGNVVLEFNMKDHTHAIQRIGDSGEGFFDFMAEPDGENAWLTPYKADRIIRWKTAGEEYREYKILEEEDRNLEFPLLTAMPVHDRLLLFPFQSRKMRVYNLETGRQEELADGEWGVKQHLPDSVFYYTMAEKLEENKALAFFKPESSLQIWSDKGMEESIPVRLSEKEALEASISFLSECFKADESGRYYSCGERKGGNALYPIALETFLDYICVGDMHIPDIWLRLEHMEGHNGSNIHKESMNILKKQGRK